MSISTTTTTTDGIGVNPEFLASEPILASTINTTGTFEVYDVLHAYKTITCLHKFHTLKEFKKRWDVSPLDPNYFMISTGIQESNFSNLYEMVEFTGCKWLCIDIENGYMEQLVTFCNKCRNSFQDITIVVRNNTIQSN